MTALLVVLGAAVGAPLRYLVDQLVRTRYEGPFPWGTLIVNVTGSALLGALAGAGTALPHLGETDEKVLDCGIAAIRTAGRCRRMDAVNHLRHASAHADAR